MVGPAKRREVVDHLRQAHRISIRRACSLAGLSRSVWSYRHRRSEPEGFRKRMLELAVERPRFSYPRIYILLRREGFAVNHKRTRRIYREENLQVRRRKRAAAAPRDAPLIPELPHQRWSMDFVSDRLEDGRTFRVRNIVDDCSRLCSLWKPTVTVGRTGRSRP